ncbi:VanW family protein [Caminicella sporogenes]|nr:VanW family protein [Caminicella sporogenes]
MKFEEKKDKNKEKIFSILIVLLSVIFFSSVSVGIALFMIFSDSIHNGVYVENIDVGGLSVAEAVNKVEDEIGDIDGKDKLMLHYKDKVWVFKGNEIGLKYDLKKAINDAFLIGRKGNLLDRFKTVLELFKNPHNISIKTSLDFGKLDKILSAIEKEINKPCVEASIKRIKGKFVIKDEAVGLILDREKTKEIITRELLKRKYDELVEVNLVVKPVYPKYTSEMLSYITDLLGSHTTIFNLNKKGRSHNIYLASKALDGTVLLPGEIFSFNKIVGPRSISNGYQAAPVIYKGELIDGIGGGVCQVSSTIYNSVLKSQLEVIERVNHTIPSTYVPKGLDATVAYGVLDFKFQNTTKYPIYIQSFVKGNKLTVNIYGHKENNQIVKLISKIDKVIKKDTEILFDENLPEDKMIVKSKGRNGYIVSSYMIIYENGREIKRKLISKDYYKPSKEVIIKGTKKIKSDDTSIEEKDKIENQIIN